MRHWPCQYTVTESERVELSCLSRFILFVNNYFCSILKLAVLFLAMSKEVVGDVQSMPTTPQTFSRGKKGKFCSKKKAAHLTSIARGKISHVADAMEESRLESEPEASHEELDSSCPPADEGEFSDSVFADDANVSDSEGTISLFVTVYISNSQKKLGKRWCTISWQPVCCPPVT